MPSRIISRLFASLAAVFLAVSGALLVLCASSCYYSWSMSGEGYEGGHVYLVKVPGGCVNFDYFESQDAILRYHKISLCYRFVKA